MIKANSYYSIACNEFWYLRDAVSPVYCNPAAASAQQIAEKMLKSVAELVCTGIEKLMTSHNLRALYDEIKRVDTSLQLERKDLALLKDYYYDARYPGDNFVIVTVDELREALEIMLDVVEAVNCWRTSHELEILIDDPRGGVSISNEQIETEILKLCENLYTQNINALLKNMEP